MEPQLARLGELAERFFHDDAPSSLIKSRQFAELLANQIAARNGLDLPPRCSFDELLRLLRDEGLLPREAGDLFHYVRRVGNQAAHENVGTAGEALTALKMAWQLAIWFKRTYLRNPNFNPGPFKPPKPPADASEPLRAEIAELRRVSPKLKLRRRPGPGTPRKRDSPVRPRRSDFGARRMTGLPLKR